MVNINKIQSLRRCTLLLKFIIRNSLFNIPKQNYTCYPSHSIEKSCSVYLFEKSCLLETYCLQINFFWRFLHISSSRMNFVSEKEKYLTMSVEEKRKEYACKVKFVTLDRIPSWQEYGSNMKLKAPPGIQGKTYERNNALNDKVAHFVGDITALEIDAIVNAANNTLKGGGGVDGAIHRAAGPSLLAECSTLGGCATGDAKITGGYKLPAKYVIHTVGPVGEHPDLLKNCYETTLNVAKANNVSSIAFPCISTGVYGYPNENAAHVAISTVREWLEKNHEAVYRIIFCLFLPVDIEIYEKLMPHYFPL